MAPKLDGVTSLFVDSVPPNLSSSWLRVIFQRVGKVDDVFILKKPRKHTNDCFAFVRFRKYAEAMNAIKVLNGYSILDKKLNISLAKYNKGGSPISSTRPKVSILRNRRISTPTLRDERTYFSALMGENPGEHQTYSSPAPSLFSLRSTLRRMNTM